MKEDISRRKKLLLLILVILAVTLIAWYLLSDHQPPEVENLDYKKIVRKGEQQQITVTVKEKNPANSLKLELNGSSLEVPLIKNFGNGTIVYSTSFDPSKISSREGYLAGTLILKDASGNEARSQVKFLANLKEPEIGDLRIDRVSLGNYKISAQIADDSAFNAFLQFLNGTKIPLTKTDGRYAANVSTLTDLDFMLKAVDAYNMSSSIQGTIKITGRDKFEMWLPADFNKDLSLSLYDYSSLLRELFEQKKFDVMDRILKVAQLNGSAVPKNLAYQVLDQIERDKRVSDKVATASTSFDLLAALGISNLNNKASIYIPGNYSLAIFQGLPKHQNADLTRLFIASESCPDIVDFEPITIKDVRGQAIVIQSSNLPREYWMIAEFLSKRPEIASQAQKFEWINRMIQQIAWDIFDNEYGPGYFDHKTWRPTNKEVWEVILGFHDYMDALPAKLERDGIGVIFPYHDSSLLRSYIADKTNRTIALLYLADLPAKCFNITNYTLKKAEAWKLYEQGKIDRQTLGKLLDEAYKESLGSGMEGGTKLFIKLLPKEYEEIVNAITDPTIITKPAFSGTKSDWANLRYQQWLNDRAGWGLPYTVEQFKQIDQFLTKNWKHWDLVKFIYGYESFKPDWSGEWEMYAYGLPVAYTALGIPLGQMGIRGTSGNLGGPSNYSHGEFAIYGIPQDVIDKLINQRELGRIAIAYGNGVSMLSGIDGVEKDTGYQITHGIRYQEIYLWKK